MTTDPYTPLNYYHRFLQKIVSVSNSSYSPTPENLDLLNTVFKKAGGSWEKLQLGSTKDIVLLKKIVRIAIKKKLLHKKPDFDGKVSE